MSVIASGVCPGVASTSSFRPPKSKLVPVKNQGGNFPRLGGVSLWVESARERPAKLIGSDLGLRIFPRAQRVFAGELCVHAVHVIELPVAADVIVMRMRVQHDDGEFREFGSELLDI